MEKSNRRLSLGELQHIDSLISLAQEQGIKPDGNLKANKDLTCCGALAAEAKGKLVFNAHDRDIFHRMAELESQIESMPTLSRLVEIRGELLRELKNKE